MKKIAVQVKDDHLEFLSRAKPMIALAELVWNALDADASEVHVEFEENDMGGEEALRVRDNGHGLDYEHALVVFQNLGGSWKRENRRTNSRRALHGQYGKGRFRAFALGNRVEWFSVFGQNGERRQYSILGRAATLGEFDVTDPAVANGSVPGGTGVTVLIADLASNIVSLRGQVAVQEATDLFAPYLREYPGVKIYYDGVPLDPAGATERCTDYDLGEVVLQGGERAPVKLSVVEWTTPGKRGIVLCDGNGFGLHRVAPRILVRGFSYTAYVKSPHFAKMENEGLLELEEMAPDFVAILDIARGMLRRHFSNREVERGRDLIAQWREEGLYPYEGEPADESQERERRVFDIYATHLSQFANFAQSNARNRRLILRLIQELVRVEPVGVARLLDDIAEFPEDKQIEVKGILQV